MKTENNAIQNQNNETYKANAANTADQNAQGRRSYDEIGALAARAAAGERAAEETLILAFKPLILKLAAPFPDFEDARADGILWTLEAIRAFEPERGIHFTVFLERSLEVHYHVRWRQFKIEAVSFEEEDSGVESNIQRAEQAAEMKIQIDKLKAAIPELTELERAIIDCVFVKNMREKAIAKTRGVSPGTVKTAKYRALRKLRKNFLKNF